MASPPSPRGRAPRTASALASSSSSCTSCAHAAPASCTSARKAAWSPATAPVCAAAALAPAAEAPTLSTATPMPASAHSASASHSRAPSPSLSRKRATERTPSRWAIACSQSPASTTAWLPHETTVCRRRPRRAASALTATLPLCEMTATWPASRRHERVAPQRRAVVEGDDPVAVGPAHRQVVAVGRGAQRGLQAPRRRASRRSPPRRRRRRRTRARRPARSPRARPPRGWRRRPRRRARAGRPRSARTCARARAGASGARPSTRPRKPSAPEVAQRLVGVGAGSAGGADDGDRARREQWRQVHQCSTRSTPRRSRARATIRRWISLVPSQMRSTRSSRHRRSATFVRM